VETRQHQEQIDSFLREANVLRMRGQAAEAEERCRRVLEVAPEDPTALEMLGDLLRGCGRLEEAAGLYQKAVAAAPNRVAPETKFAEITLELAERQRTRDMASLMLQRSVSPGQVRRNLAFAIFLSAIFPGLGQFYNHEGVKGTLLVSAALICLAVGGASLFRLVFTVTAARSAGPVDSFGAWFGMLGFILWLYSVIDAVVTAQKRGRAAGGGPGG
jgi:tetratricopeptide (TPR) repeat protein